MQLHLAYFLKALKTKTIRKSVKNGKSYEHFTIGTMKLKIIIRTEVPKRKSLILDELILKLAIFYEI